MSQHPPSRPQTSPSPFRPIQSPAGPNTYANMSHSSPVKPAPTANMNYKSSLEHSNSTGKFFHKARVVDIKLSHFT